MSEFKEKAKAKLLEEKKSGKYDRYANVMKEAVCDALLSFCKQNEEFAQAVVQSGSFENCMKKVAENCHSSLSDLEAFKRAVNFYFPGSDVLFQMQIILCEADKEYVQETKPETKPVLLSLDDFF